MDCIAVSNLKIETNRTCRIETNRTCRKCKKSAHNVVVKPDWAAQSVNLLEIG